MTTGVPTKEANSTRWCFATSPTGHHCLARLGHEGPHAAYSSAPQPFEVWSDGDSTTAVDQ